MRLVILESPYAGNVERNLAYGRACLADCLQRDESPIASHLLLTQPGVLDDNDPAQRSRGIDAGHAWLSAADAMVVYIDHGVTPGMQRGVELARLMNMPVEFRSLKPGGYTST